MAQYLKSLTRNLLKEVTGHSCVTFLSDESCIVNGSIDALQYDEVKYLKSKWDIDDFKFNGGWNSFFHRYYVASLENVFVEPDFFIAIKGVFSVIKESVFYDWFKVAKGKYLKARLFFFWRIQKLDVAILFDGAVGLNYFHFHNDILTKLAVVKGFQNAEAPLVISKRLFNSALFQFYYQSGFVRSFNWLILDENQYLRVTKLYVIKARQFDFAALTCIADLTVKVLKAAGDLRSEVKRMFINRREHSLRYIPNFDQLEPILVNHGFVVVYLEDFTIEKQLALMRNAELIVGIHGAGLTNVIFANREKVQVIEIFPMNFVPTHYYWLCNSLSIKYKAFFGGDLVKDGGFEIDVERFEEVISRYTYN